MMREIMILENHKKIMHGSRQNLINLKTSFFDKSYRNQNT